MQNQDPDAHVVIAGLAKREKERAREVDGTAFFLLPETHNNPKKRCCVVIQ